MERNRTISALAAVVVLILLLSALYARSCEPRRAAAALDGLRWELPCQSDSSQSALCDTLPMTSVTTVLTAAPSSRFLVELRFRGVVETKSYVGGTNEGVHWQVGGTPASDTFNVYTSRITDPPQVYYLNGGGSFGPAVSRIDYTKVVEIGGGAKIELVAESIDNIERVNRDVGGNPIAVSDVTPTVFDGQFIQLDVVSVKPTP
jgi:hypothetical protein